MKNDEMPDRNIAEQVVRKRGSKSASSPAKKYLVYIHTTPDGRKYIGITSEKNPKERWGKGGNGYEGSLFYDAILGYGWDNIKHEVVCTGLTKKQATQKEVELIALLKTMDRRYGFNTSPGGNYASKETKAKMADARRRMKGSDHPCNKPIFQIDRETGEILNRFPSAELAAQAIGGWGPSISKCARSGEGCVGGYLWCYEKDWTESFFDKYRGITWRKEAKGWCDVAKQKKKRSEEAKARMRQHGKRIICVETGSEYINAMHAYRDTGITFSAIYRCCKGKAKSAGGYTRKYTEREVRSI